MAPQGAKKDSFAACFWGKLKLACTLTSRIDYTSIKLFEFPRKTSRASVELGMSKESIGFFHTSTPWRTTGTLYKDEKGK